MICEILNEDCISRGYADDWDHIITDPPYSPKVHKKAATMRGGKAGKNDLGFEHLTPLLRASIARRVALSKSWSVIFSDWEGLGAWRRDIEESGGEWVRVIPWERWSMPQLSGDRPTSGSEAVIIAHGGGKKSWNGPGNLTGFHQKAMRGKDKHKTQKPLDLMLQIVHHFTEPGARIFDPCAGRGTTVLAAKLLGRSASGTEIDREEAIKAGLRLQAPTAQDAEQAARWKVLLDEIEADKARCSAHTKKVRK